MTKFDLKLVQQALQEFTYKSIMALVLVLVLYLLTSVTSFLPSYSHSPRPRKNTFIRHYTPNDMEARLLHLETLVTSQTAQIHKLQQQCKSLTSQCEYFATIITNTDPTSPKTDPYPNPESILPSLPSLPSVFGSAPSSVVDAADAAGAAILAALLGGQQRMLVDVNDAELSSSTETLAQFVELAILPVAAGLEGLNTDKNRLKIIFPTVTDLSAFRKSYTLASPDVIALGTLGFGSAEEKDGVVVIVAPSPEDEEFQTMINIVDEMARPTVIINYHVPEHGVEAKFPERWNLTPVYFLRLLNVQFQKEENPESEVTRAMLVRQFPRPWHVFVDTAPLCDESDFEIGESERAAPPRPQNCFSNHSLCRFLAATFPDRPSISEVDMCIVTCLEGGADEDELVSWELEQQEIEKESQRKKGGVENNNK